MARPSQPPADVSMREFLQRMEDDFDETKHTQRIYSKATETLVGWVDFLWQAFCDVMKKNALETLKELHTNTLHAFFYYILWERRENIKSASTLQTYWNAFAIVRKKRTGNFHIEPLTKAQMHGVRQFLAGHFKLRTEKKDKPIMRVEDEFKLLETLWMSNEMHFEHERYRIQLALLIQLAGITGNRPQALLNLKYGQIKLSILPDPEDSSVSRLLLDFKFKHTKGYLGEKSSNTIAIPDIPHEPCLLLCPQTTFLALAFADGALTEAGVTNPDDLFRLGVKTGLGELEIPWNLKMENVYIFRPCSASAQGSQISETTNLSYGTMRMQLRRLGEVTGMRLPVGPYCFRRGAGEALDNSSHISDAQRNLILQHASSSVFEKNYASTYITSDLQAVYRGEAPQTQLMRQASGMSRSIDPRRPRKLNASQLLEVKRHPELRRHRRRKQELFAQLRQKYGSIGSAQGTCDHDEYHNACRLYKNAKVKLEKEHLAAIKSRYSAEQPILDIKQQLSGRPIDDVPPVRREIYKLRERTEAVDALFIDTRIELVDEKPSRIDAIRALACLSKLREGWRPRGNVSNADNTEDAKEDMVKPQVFVPPLRCKPNQCIFCLGQTELAIDRRTHEFYSSSDAKAHVRRTHLKHLPNNSPVACPLPPCSKVLLDVSHLRRHALEVHAAST